MATRGRIGVQLADGSILSIYSHWDNYPSFAGVKLVEHFNSYEKAAELIDGGDISCLWTNAGWNNETLPTTGPQYYSSRGDVTEPRLDETLDEYLGNGEQYAYLFANGEWICYDTCDWHDTFKQKVEIPVPVAA